MKRTAEQDILAWANKPSGPLPFLTLGGMSAIAPGSADWLMLSLNPIAFTPAARVALAQVIDILRTAFAHNVQKEG